MKIDGRGMHEEINHFIRQEEYRTARDPIKAGYIARTIGLYRQAAMRELMAQDPGIEQTLRRRIEEKEKGVRGEAGAEEGAVGLLMPLLGGAVQAPQQPQVPQNVGPRLDQINPQLGR